MYYSCAGASIWHNFGLEADSLQQHLPVF